MTKFAIKLVNLQILIGKNLKFDVFNWKNCLILPMKSLNFGNLKISNWNIQFDDDLNF